LSGIRGLRYASLILITHQFSPGEPLCLADSGGGTMRDRIRSEDLHKAGSLELRGAATSAIFDTLNGSNGNRNKQVSCLGCYDRDFECLGEFTKIEGRNK
jgi:hypothetical protein